MEVGDEELRTVFSEEYLDAELRNRFEELKNSPYVPTEVLIAICVQGFVAFIGILANLLVIIVTIFGNTRQVSKLSYLTVIKIRQVKLAARETFQRLFGSLQEVTVDNFGVSLKSNNNHVMIRVSLMNKSRI